MARIVVELTNRCNLSCRHCFSGRHGGRDDLPMSVLDRVLAEAGQLGFSDLSFTGGDPTLHPQFAEIIRRTASGGYRFGMVTNGWNFPSKYPHVIAHRDQLSAITFSLDGAGESTHDRLRGRGSFRRVLQAFSICTVKEIPFTINMVVTAENRHEILQMAQLATNLGSRGLRLGHLMPTPTTTPEKLDLTLAQRSEVESEVRHLQQQFELPIAIAPGFQTPDLFPCAPLQMKELNVDCRGNVTKCCHLSGHGDGVGCEDVIGNLTEMTFARAYERLVTENNRFRADKQARHAAGNFQDHDYLPCWYCSVHYRKVDWLRDAEKHVWPLRCGG